LSADALIVFIRNPIPGKVKSRLAAETGVQEAIRVYLRLLEKTFQLCAYRQENLAIYFSDMIDGSVLPFIKKAQFYTQQGENLGERMFSALEFQLQKHNKAVLIGSDCPELSQSILDLAFQLLDSSDIVIGPAADGGYYLIGVKEPADSYFKNISWGSSHVFEQTIERIGKIGKTFSLLPVLRDLDTLEDLKHFEARGII
jgi:hypothetical protein